MTDDQMNHFPQLKEAILTNTSVETPQEEMNRLQDLLEFFDTETFPYQNEYYEIGFLAAE